MMFQSNNSIQLNLVACLSALLFFAAQGSLIAQPDFRSGYILTSEQDTLRGFIDFKSEDICKYKSTSDAEVAIYRASQIESYGFDGNRVFQSIGIPVEKGLLERGFAEVLILGKASLYRYNRDFYLQVDSDKLNKLETKRNVKVRNGQTYSDYTYLYVGVLNYLLGDCIPYVVDENNTSLNEKKLFKLVVAYNQCKSADFTVFKEKKKFAKATLGIQAGLMSSQLSHSGNVSTHPFPQFDTNSNEFLFGFSTEFSSPRTSEHVALFVDFNFTKFNYNELVIREARSYTSQRRLDLGLKTIDIPIGFKWSVPMGNIRPYLKGGFIFRFIRKQSFSSSETIIRSGSTSLSDDERLVFNGSQFGFLIGLGMPIYTTDKLSSYFEVRYDKTSFVAKTLQYPAIYSSNQFTTKNNTISLILGLRFG